MPAYIVRTKKDSECNRRLGLFVVDDLVSLFWTVDATLSPYQCEFAVIGVRIEEMHLFPEISISSCHDDIEPFQIASIVADDEPENSLVIAEISESESSNIQWH